VTTATASLTEDLLVGGVVALIVTTCGSRSRSR
jgi:hypothetical protein